MDEVGEQNETREIGDRSRKVVSAGSVPLPSQDSRNTVRSTITVEIAVVSPRV